MRISKVQLAGLVAALAGGTAQNAAADDLSVTTARTDPVFTATASNNSPGDVSVTAAGSITIEEGEAAITVNSSNADADPEFVSNAGALRAENEDDVIGILLGNGFSGAISHTGSITFSEEYVPEDLDDDGEVDEPFAIGQDRFGIYQAAGNTYTGNITSTGSIGIEGVNSGGMFLLGTLDGNLNSSGNFNIIGDNSHAVVLGSGGAGGVTGDVFLRGTMSARGENASALIVDGLIGGELRLNGSVIVSGFRSTTPPADDDDLALLDDDDLLNSGAAVLILNSVTDGVTVEGVGSVDEEDDDGDGLSDDPDEDTPDADDDNSAAIRSFGSSPAVHVNAEAGVNIVFGAVTGPTAPAGAFGFVNRGTISGLGTYGGFSGNGLRFEAIFGSSSIDLGDGIFNDGLITATSSEENATGLYVGNAVSAPTIANTNGITAAASGADPFDAYAIYIDEQANVTTIDNDGTIRAQFNGATGNATAIYDASAANSITTINNTGEISAAAFSTDDDVEAGGYGRAIDLSLATQGITITQTANADEDVTPIISGDVVLGSGADDINLLAGAMNGAVSFGGGADAFVLDGESVFAGTIDDSDGLLDIDVLEATLRLNAGTELQATSVDFGADATFIPVLTQGDPALIVADTITFAGDATNHAAILPAIPAGLLEGSHVFLTATSSMTGGDLVTGVVTGDNVPFVYNVEISLTDELAADGAANSLEASYTLKSAAQLGMTSNQGAAYLPIIQALREDDDASAALTSLDTAGEFYDAYEDLLPSFSSAATELSATAIQQMQSATANRLAATRLHDLNDTSVWAQEIGYTVTRTPPTTNGQEYDGQGFGIATGIDGPLDNGALFGLSASFITSEVEEAGRPEGEIAVSIGQFNAYLGTAIGPLDVDFILGAGVGKLSSQRTVEIGSSFTAMSEADWWTYEGHGALRVSAPMQVSNWLIMTPQAAVTYAYLSEEGYEEEGGGVAIDYEADAANSQRLWGDVGVEFSGRLAMSGETVVAPRIFAGYRANLIDEEAERTFRFLSGTEEFTLVDDPLGDGAPIVGIGVDATNGFSTFTLGYEGEFGDQIERHSLNASIRFRF